MRVVLPFRFALVFGFSLLSLISVSCAESEVSVETQQQELVFNERTVDQPRGELLLASVSTVYGKRQQRAYFRAHAANSAGTLFADICETNGSLQSSAVLSGPDRVVTAFHTIRTDATVEISFGGRSDGSGRVIDDELLIGIEFPDNSDFRSGAREENVLLAHRLWALGLKSWALNNDHGKQLRSNLRRWSFSPVWGSVPNTWNQQGFLTYDEGDSGATGRDIAVLEVKGGCEGTEGCDQDENCEGFDVCVENVCVDPKCDTQTMFGEESGHPAFVRTGPFVLDKPGVFFDWLKYFQFEQMEVNGELPLAAVHSTLWPDASGGDSYPLASRDGYYMKVMPTREFDVCTGEEKESVDRYEKNILTTIDVTAGSSGGALLVEDVNERVDGGTRANFIKRIFATGVVSWSTAEGERPWQTYETIGEPDPKFVGSANVFATIMQDDLDSINSKVGPAFHPNDRKACENGENAPNCISCSSFDVDGNCEDFLVEPATGSGSAEFAYRGLQPNDEESSKRDTRERSVRCWFNENGTLWVTGQESTKQPGVIVGFLGGTVDWKESALDPAVAIGTLFAVCAPLSSMPYTDNWELLQLKGGSVPYEKDSIGGRLGWGPLNRSLQYAYELRTHGEREEEFPAVRPVSMKLCPPNTVVNGATFRTVGEGEFGPRHAGGLVSLSCTALRNNSQDPLFPDYIAYLSDSVDPDLQSYPLDGKPFPLTQRIGEPVGFGGMDIQGCQNSDKPVATGLETTHDNDGRLIQVKLLCGQGP